MDSIQAQRILKEKDLIIFTSELQRRSKSVVLTYVLWSFLGSFGIHQFYMGKVFEGVAYFILGTLGLTFFLLSSSTGMLWVVFEGVLAFFLLWDLFTIPKQLALRDELVKKELLAQFENNRTYSQLSAQHVDFDPVSNSRAVQFTDTRTCPYCAEQIKVEAKICRYCGKELSPLEWVPKSTTPGLQEDCKSLGSPEDCERVLLEFGYKMIKKSNGWEIKEPLGGRAAIKTFNELAEYTNSKKIQNR